MIEQLSPTSFSVDGFALITIHDNNGMLRMCVRCGSFKSSSFYCLTIDVRIGFVELDIPVNEINPGPTPLQVCVTSGVQGDIELELVVTFDITSGEAGKS